MNEWIKLKNEECDSTSASGKDEDGGEGEVKDDGDEEEGRWRLAWNAVFFSPISSKSMSSSVTALLSPPHQILHLLLHACFLSLLNFTICNLFLILTIFCCCSWLEMMFVCSSMKMHSNSINFFFDVPCINYIGWICQCICLELEHVVFAGHPSLGICRFKFLLLDRLPKALVQLSLFVNTSFNAN